MKKLGVIFLGLTVWSNLSIAQPNDEAESTGTTTSTGGIAEGTSIHILNGQEDTGGGFNKYSIRPIHESDVMYQKTIVRAMDLREKQNKPMFSQNRWITKLIIEAVKRGDITPYTTDSLEEGGKLTIDEFSKAMSIGGAVPTTMEVQDAVQNKINDGSLDPATQDTTGTFDKTLAELIAASGAGEFMPRDLYQMEIKENIIFDKQRSRMYYDIHSVTIKIPADHPDNKKGIEMVVASFSFRDLLEKVFKDNPNAIWYNPQNDAQHKTLADAFELRLFSSYIIKVSNPSDAMLQDIYGDPERGIMASQWAAFELLEYEHNLWEF
jgi:gliding motility associated protien GldN